MPSGHRGVLPGHLSGVYVPTSLLPVAEAFAFDVASGALSPLGPGDFASPSLRVAMVLVKGKGERSSFAGIVRCSARVIRATASFVEVLPSDGPGAGVPVRFARGSLRIVAERVPENR